MEQFQIVVRGRAGFCTPAPIQVNLFDDVDEAKVAAELQGYGAGEYRILPYDARLDITSFDESTQAPVEVTTEPDNEDFGDQGDEEGNE